MQTPGRVYRCELRGFQARESGWSPLPCDSATAPVLDSAPGLRDAQGRNRSFQEMRIAPVSRTSLLGSEVEAAARDWSLYKSVPYTVRMALQAEPELPIRIPFPDGSSSIGPCSGFPARPLSQAPEARLRDSQCECVFRALHLDTR